MNGRPKFPSDDQPAHCGALHAAQHALCKATNGLLLPSFLASSLSFDLFFLSIFLSFDLSISLSRSSSLPSRFPSHRHLRSAPLPPQREEDINHQHLRYSRRRRRRMTMMRPAPPDDDADQKRHNGKRIFNFFRSFSILRIGCDREIARTLLSAM